MSQSTNAVPTAAQTEKIRILELITELFNYSSHVPAVDAILNAILLPNGATLKSVVQSIASGDQSHAYGLDHAVASALATLTEKNLHPRQAPSANSHNSVETMFNWEEDLENDIERVINAALKALQNNIIDPATLTTLQLRLHTIFISSISSLIPSTPANVRVTLGKMSKLIQLLGVLSGLQLPVIPIPASTPTEQPPETTPLIHSCPHPTCLKTFSKAYDLRIHSRVHANYRPFACPTCPATFTRKHDLQRHARSHPYQGPYPNSHEDTRVSVVRCTICSQTFSRRDAFLRHTRGSRSKDKPGDRSQCATALGETILAPSSTLKEVDRSGGDIEESSEMDTIQSNPFSIFSEMDLAPMDMDLSQLLGSL